MVNARLPGQNWFEDDRRRPSTAVVLGVGGLGLMLVVLVVAFAASGGGGGHRKASAATSAGASAPPSPTTLTSEPVDARPVPDSQLAALRPQAVTLGVYGGQLKVTWSPPQQAGQVGGYFVTTQTADGHVDRRLLVGVDAQLTAVFDDPTLCASVTTVVSTPQGLELARGDLLCPAGSTPDAGTAS